MNLGKHTLKIKLNDINLGNIKSTKFLGILMNFDFDR